MTQKTIEETYKKLSQREHILMRSGMYIGSTKKCLEELWIAEKNNDTGAFKMKKQMVEYTPGFMKIFDEILTNATDHAARDSTVNIIKVDFDQSTGIISVWNNGKGIPVVLHKDHNMYVPELIFGHFLSGSNYDDTQTRTGAGTNGIGSKASAVYSKKFIVETIDSENQKKFIQEFTDNMENRTKPKITSNSGKSYTKITFLPDYQRFGMSGLEDDTITLIQKRVLDCIACTGSDVQVYLNGQKLKGKGLIDYTKFFFNSDHHSPIFSESFVLSQFIWEWAIVPSDTFEQISFVNGNSTTQGGKHVDFILNQIVSKLKVLLETKKKLKDIKPTLIKERLFLFLRATIANPSFNSQTKEYLTTPVKDFGCRFEVSDKFIDKLYKSSIVEDIIQTYRLKESLELAKSTNGKKVSRIFIPKLEDAIWAGTAKSDQCTLILTEGDSAKTFAMWGRSIVGNERYGIMPLRGKAINVRDATVSQLMNNEELNNLKQIIGLKAGKEYLNTSDLRYGKVLVLTDADLDGSHITSLIVNMFHAQFPSLIKLDFLQTLRTPIVKATRNGKTVEFFTEQDYNAWKETVGESINGFRIKYFKGLGTSKKEDAQAIFKRFSELKADFYYRDHHCDEAILLAFDKDKNVAKPKGESTEGTNVTIKCSDRRKHWLSNYNRNDFLDIKQSKIAYSDLINKGLIHFSIYDNVRSIPHLIDGLKPSQRKILWYMLEKKITRDIKVAQLSGYVSAETSYHHGEASLQGAIIGMAQDFVGSNNLNLLVPEGNFGCLDPNTDIIMWDGSVKKAKNIIIGDKLIGDNGQQRTVLKTTHGTDTMYKISTDNDSYIVNSKHILTLKFSYNKKIFWKESSQSWNVNYFDKKLMKECYKQFRTINSSKEEALQLMKNYINNIDSPDDGIFDIGLDDFLKLPKCTQMKFFSIKNSSCIDWKEKEIPIDPYIFGTWIGDGASNGNGITSIDEEILKEWVIYLDSIDCELVHTPGNKLKNHDNYSYTIRKKGFGFKRCIGDKGNSSENCYACQSYTKSSICDWHFEKKSSNSTMNIVKKIKKILLENTDEFQLLLKNDQIISIKKSFKLKLKYQNHKKILWKNKSKNNKKYWYVDYFDGINAKTKYMLATDKNKSQILDSMKDFVSQLNIQDSEIFIITVEDYLKLSKSTQSKFTVVDESLKHSWKRLLSENNLLNNKHIPPEYIFNSKENRLRLLAGIIDTDGTKANSGYRYIISQSKRLREHVIKSLQLICHSLGFETSISETKNHKLTKNNEDSTMLNLSIYGNNLDEIPTKLKRKQMQKYENSNSTYLKSFKIECIGKGQFCGWEIDGNERFLLNNFLITHNSRFGLGKDAASPRYIFTRLQQWTTVIFDQRDAQLLNYLNDDGQSIEPDYFIPIIPMALVNGCEGIGTGFSTYIPPHDPKDLIDNLLRVLDDQEPVPMRPYFKGFKGIVEEHESDVVGRRQGSSWVTRGRWKKLSSTQIEITELPVGTGITGYKEFLEGMIEGTSAPKKKGDTKEKERSIKFPLRDVKNNTKDENSAISFLVDFKYSADLEKLITSGTLEKELKLTKSFTTTNMYLFDESLIPTKYLNTTDILLDFYDIRLDMYTRRRNYLVDQLQKDLTILRTKVRFIREYISGELDINRKSKNDIFSLLEKKGYSKHPEEHTYDFLIRMQIASLTKEKIEELDNQTEEKERELADLQNKTEKDLWREDLLKLKMTIKN
jgi:DNA gyrase/topoisomerase IV subunit B